MVKYRAKALITKLNKLITVLTVLALSLTIAAPAAYADSGSDTETKTVKIGYYENEVFEEGARDDVPKKGYAYEYYQKLSEYTGWKYEYVYGSFSVLYQKLIDGKIDMLAGLAKKEEREGIIGYPDAPMGSETYNLIKHVNDNKVTADPSTMNGRKIGVLESAVADSLKKYLDEHKITADVKVYSDNKDMFEDFDKDVIDVLAVEGDGAYGRNNVEVLCSFGASDYYLCVDINNKKLLKELNTAQMTLDAEEPNYITSLRAKFYPISVASRAMSDAEKKWIKNNDSITFGYLKGYLPYCDEDSKGNVTGMLKEYVPEMFEQLGLSDINVKYKSYSNYDDMINSVTSGETDAVFPVGGGMYFAEKSGIYQSTHVLSSSTDLVYMGEYSDEITTDFAVNENNRMQYYYVKNHYPDAKISYYPSIDACLEAVMTGKVNCAMLYGLLSSEILRNSKYDKLSLRQLSINDDRCFGVKIGNEGLLKLLNRGVGVLGTDYARRVAYHNTEGLYKYTLVDLLRDNIVWVILLVVAICTFVILILVRDSLRKKKQIKIVESARCELETKNCELAKSEQALSEALMSADRANHAKTAFLNNMSHDIRTPMNAIVGFTAMAATNIENKDRVRDCLAKITVSSRHLLSLINDVLDMSRIESGKIIIEENEVHLPELIHDLWTIIQSSVKTKHQELFIDTNAVRSEDIITDKLRLNQVLLNILTNAVKFTPDGGTISFRVTERATDVKNMTEFEFRIKDNGIGMSEEFQKVIFNAFTRERSSTVSKTQGTGLGMAITKNIVDLMNGTITVKSEVGKGSEFIVNIRCKVSENSAKFEKPPELQGLRALVADDSTDNCLSVCSMLRDIGLRPVWTNFGKEAVIRAREAFEQNDKFRVYIIDWLMPDQNGIETVRQIRKIIGNDDPIIILTAYDWSEIEEEARAAGVTSFCSKPLFMSELRDVLTEPFRNKSEESSEKSAEPDFNGKRVLLAEDNELNQMIAVSILENAGFEVDIADDGQKTVDMIKAADSGYYDIVLMDIQMPHMDGYEAAKLIRSLPESKKASIPIIAVTANAFAEDKKIALEAGMDGYLAKPYDIPEMMKLLGDLLC